MNKAPFVKNAELQAVNQRPGLTRRTMTYNEDIMMCMFEEEQGFTLELHTHEAVQSGYMISGKVKFFKEDGSYIIVEPGDSYTFDSMEAHGSECLEHAVFIECFTPMRREYM